MVEMEKRSDNFYTMFRYLFFPRSFYFLTGKMPSIENHVVQSWLLFFQILFLQILQIQIIQPNIFRLGLSIFFLYFLHIHTFIPRLSYVKNIATVNQSMYENTPVIKYSHCCGIYYINTQLHSCINHELEMDGTSGLENFYHRKHGRYKY